MGEKVESKKLSNNQNCFLSGSSPSKYNAVSKLTYHGNFALPNLAPTVLFLYF